MASGRPIRGPHQWRALKRYPCDLEAADAWGNLLAFKTDPGIWALTGAVNRSVKRFEEKKAATPPQAQGKRQRRHEGIKTNPLEVKLAKAQNRVDALEHQLSEVFGSTSWRITAPLRLARTASNGS
jgi:hypothetical protein